MALSFQLTDREESEDKEPEPEPSEPGGSAGARASAGGAGGSVGEPPPCPGSSLGTPGGTPGGGVLTGGALACHSTNWCASSFIRSLMSVGIAGGGLGTQGEAPPGAGGVPGGAPSPSRPWASGGGQALA